MKRKNYKLISAILVTCIIVTSSFSICVFAADTGMKLEEHISGVSGFMDVTEKAVLERFLGNEQQIIKGEAKNISSAEFSAEYEYDLFVNELSNTFWVELDLNLCYGDQTQYVNFEGNVVPNILSDGEIYLSGPLCKHITLNNKKYEIILGFNKVLNKTGFSGCITLYPLDNSDDSFVRFRIGDDIMTENIIEQLVERNVETKSQMIENNIFVSQKSYLTERTMANFTKRGSAKYGTFSLLDGNAHKSEIYFKPGVNSYDAENLIAVAVTSYCDNAHEQLAGVTSYYTRVGSIEVNLSRFNHAPLVEDFWLYSENGMDGDGYNIISGDEFGSLLTDLVALVIPSAAADALSVFSAMVSVNAAINIAEETSSNITSFGGVGANFDETPYILVHMLSGTPSTGTYSYSASVKITYVHLDDGGTYYYNGNYKGHDFTVNYVHV